MYPFSIVHPGTAANTDQPFCSVNLVGLIVSVLGVPEFPE